MKTVTIRAMAASMLTVGMVATVTGDEELRAPLPFVRDFDPEKYIGKWYEVARLPTPVQPAGTLAVAEYGAGREAGLVTVKNTSLDIAGNKISEISGQARIAEGDPPGRLLVSFGPAFPKVPNYHVIHVDRAYRFAVVGVPDRNSLWILAREVPIAAEALKTLQEIADKAGFDVAKLQIAPWSQVPNAGRDGGS